MECASQVDNCTQLLDLLPTESVMSLVCRACGGEIVSNCVPDLILGSVAMLTERILFVSSSNATPNSRVTL